MKIPIPIGLSQNLAKLRQNERWTRAQVEAYQAESLWRLREYAYARSPFYQRFHQGLFERPLQEVPVLTKAMMMEHFDELVTDRNIRLADVRAHIAKGEGDKRYLSRYWVCATSDASGHPGLFLFDREEWIAILASFARGVEWSGTKVNLRRRMKFASVASGYPLPMSAQASATIKSWWMPGLRLAASEPIPEIIRQLNAFKPDIFGGYASMIRILAEEQIAGSLNIHPHAIHTSSEVLTFETRQRIETAWGRKPFNQYGSTETGGLAAECEQHRGMHLFEDLVIAEVVDRDNRPVPPGLFGEKLLVTVLFSPTQPLIRYELNDRVQLSMEPCPCGRPFALITDIQGRTEDILSFPAVAGGEVVVNPLVFHRVMDTIPVNGWQVVQETDRLIVLLSGVRERFADEALVNGLRQALQAQGAIVPPIMVKRVTYVPLTATGKAPLIKSNRST